MRSVVVAGPRAASFLRSFSLLTLVLCSALLFAAPVFAADDEESEEYAGTVTLVYQKPKNKAFAPVLAKVKASEMFENTVKQINDTIALPEDLLVEFRECGTINAFYEPDKRRILMCYEIINYFQKSFAEAYDDAETAQTAALDASLFIFHHELGHALVDLLELPITGKEEDAVDDLATLVLVREWEGGDTSALNAADSFYMIGEEEEQEAEDLEKLPYYGEHSLGKQRYYQIACTVYGSDPETHAGLVPDVLPKARAERCPAEYEQKARSWDTLLADYYWAQEEEEVEQATGQLLDGARIARKGAFGGGDDESTWVVVVNDEEQYSIWPSGRDLPAGWNLAGFEGSKPDALEWIKEKWTDMRPLSLRERMSDDGSE
jgi:uncharacterized protein YbdZ (MbtH family)